LLFKGDKKEEAMQLFTAILRNGLAHSVWTWLLHGPDDPFVSMTQNYPPHSMDCLTPICLSSKNDSNILCSAPRIGRQHLSGLMILLPGWHLFSLDVSIHNTWDIWYQSFIEFKCCSLLFFATGAAVPAGKSCDRFNSNFYWWRLQVPNPRCIYVTQLQVLNTLFKRCSAWFLIVIM
jgi:hypothetical protein